MMDQAAAGGGTMGSATGVTTGVTGEGADRTGAAGATFTANGAADMVAVADTGAALPDDVAGAAGAGTATVVMSTGAGRAGEPRATGTSEATDAMVGTTNSGTTCTTGTSIQEDPDETQASIGLPEPKANLKKDLYKTPTHEQCRLAAHIHASLLQGSLALTQINDGENKPVAGIINIPK